MFDWQNIFVLAIVAIAAGYLMRQVWLVLAKPGSGGCGGCAKKPSATSPRGEELVQLDGLKQSPKR